MVAATDEETHEKAHIRSCTARALRRLLREEGIDVHVEQMVPVYNGDADIVLIDPTTGLHLLVILVTLTCFSEDVLPEVMAHATNITCLEVVEDLRLVRQRAKDPKGRAAGKYARVDYVPDKTPDASKPAFWELPPEEEWQARIALRKLRTASLTIGVLHMGDTFEDPMQSSHRAALHCVTFEGSAPCVYTMWKEERVKVKAEATEERLGMFLAQVGAIARLGPMAVRGTAFRGQELGEREGGEWTVLKMPKDELLRGLSCMPGSEELQLKVSEWQEEAVACKSFRPDEGKNHQRQYAVFRKALGDDQVAEVDVGRAILVLCPWYEGEHKPSCVAHLVGLRMRLAQLHDQKYVHGDVRTVNVVFCRLPASEGDACSAADALASVRLIDFDLARPIGSPYPKGFHYRVNDVERHPSAREGRKMEAEHDLYAARDIFTACASPEWDRELADTWAKLFERAEKMDEDEDEDEDQRRKRKALMNEGWEKVAWTEEPWSVLLRYGRKEGGASVASVASVTGGS